MKKLFNIIVFLSTILALSSCSFFEGDKTTKEIEKIRTIVELPDSVKQKIVAQDSLMTELLNKVDTLTMELNSTKAENAELRERLEELKNPKNIWAYISIGAFVIGLIALIVALFKAKGIKEKEAIELFKECLDESTRIKNLIKNVDLLKQHSEKIKMVSSASNVETRLMLLENQFKQVHEMVDNIKKTLQQPLPRPSHLVEAEYRKIGYAKNDTDKYFMSIYDSNQEGCVFKITFTSPTSGRFNIISLDKIQSRNDWQKKVECIGDSIREASDFSLVEEGICEKIDKDTWIVTKPLKIRLKK